jgi:DNA mismatch repair ATPase MutS
MLSRKDFHIEQIAKYEAKINECKKQLKKILRIRLVLFFLPIFLLAYLGLGNTLINIIAIFVPIGAFLVLMRKESQLNSEVVFYESHKEINAHELNLLNFNFKHVEDGIKFQQEPHNYSKDLDVFGDKSIYQLLNRTCTYSGSALLAQALNCPPLKKDEILARQKAIKELSKQDAWCADFLAHGKGTSDKNSPQLIIDWLNANNTFNLRLINVLKYILPLACLSCGLLALFNIIPTGAFTMLFFLQLFLTMLFNVRITNIHNTLGKKYALINKYFNLIGLIEKQSFESHLLQDLQQKIIDTKQENSATHSIKKLKEYLDLLDARLNILMAILLNGIFLWDLNVVVKIEAWRIKNKERFIQWHNAISEFDALISIALFANSNPEYVYPEILEGEFKLVGEGLGHPLLDKTKLVKNDYYFDGKAKVDLLTGANMAGKSTFLRTIGVNILLAEIGAPVCADKFSITPVTLFTSLRTADSLQENESFFYAELKKLEVLVNLYKSGVQLFFLLDEILKGTNSNDQHVGSIGLVKKILSLNGTGIIATHDLALSSLQDEYPQNIRNLCFEIEIENNELKFDYKLKQGLCKTMNASFLMKNMGII